MGGGGGGGQGDGLCRERLTAGSSPSLALKRCDILPFKVQHQLDNRVTLKDLFHHNFPRYNVKNNHCVASLLVMKNNYA